MWRGKFVEVVQVLSTHHPLLTTKVECKFEALRKKAEHEAQGHADVLEMQTKPEPEP